MNRREFLFRVLLVTGSLAFALLAVEGGFRALLLLDRARTGSLEEQLERSRGTPMERVGNHDRLGGLVQASPYQDIIYEFKPGLKGAFLRKPLSINSAGMRDREYSLEKPPGTFRIVGLGDSVMFGWRILEEETFLAVLERWLNESAPSQRAYEVLNFAVPGYNTAIETAVFEHKASLFQPDLVIIHFVSNDWGVPKFMQRPVEPLSMKRSYFLEFVMSRLGFEGPEVRERLVGYKLKDVESEGEKLEIKSRYKYMVGRIGYRRAMNRLGRIAAMKGIPVIVLVGSTKAGHMGEIVARSRENRFHALPIKPVTERILAQYGIPNDRQVLRRKMRVAPGDPHPNAFGHYIYAVGLWEKLQEIGVIPPSPTPAFPPSDIP